MDMLYMKSSVDKAASCRWAYYSIDVTTFNIHIR